MAHIIDTCQYVCRKGIQSVSKYSSPGLWAWLHRVPRDHWPALIRGDKAWGSERNMQRAEQEGLPYLFKQRLTKKVKRLIERLMQGSEWNDAGQGWQGAEAELGLQGWSKVRRLVILQRSVKKEVVIADQSDPA